MRKEKIKERIVVIPKTALDRVIDSESLITLVFKNKKLKEKYLLVSE
jgi:hypothetical protein